MIKNVILDMGNVLLDYNPNISLDKFCRSDEEKKIIKKELFEGPEWIMGDLGEIKDRDRFELVKKRVLPKYHEALKNCAYNWDMCMVPIDGAKDFCDFVKSEGYRIYILSNASDLFYEYFPRFLPLDYFDGVFVSSDVRLIKPDVRIYQMFLEKYDLKADECFFIDDREDNVIGARKAGLYTFRFEGDYNEVKCELQKLT